MRKRMRYLPIAWVIVCVGLLGLVYLRFIQ